MSAIEPLSDNPRPAGCTNAASISGLLLTTDAIISGIKEDKPEPAGAPGE
jgi:hypothetical protein